MTQMVALTKSKSWSFFFRFGLYDPIIPINYDRSIQEAFEALSPDVTDRVIDVGCGNGRFMYHARPWLNAGGHLVGVEISEGGVAAAQQRAEQLGFADRVTIQQGNMLRLTDLNLGFFNGAVAHFTVYMLASDSERRAAIKQIAAVLRPGGRFVFAVPSESWSVKTIFTDARQIEAKRDDIAGWYSLFRQWAIYPLTAMGFRDLERGLDRDIFHRYTLDEITEHLTSAGFEDIQIQRIYGGCGYRAVARKASVSLF